MLLLTLYRRYQLISRLFQVFAYCQSFLLYIRNEDISLLCQTFDFRTRDNLLEPYSILVHLWLCDAVNWFLSKEHKEKAEPIFHSLISWGLRLPDLLGKCCILHFDRISNLNDITSQREAYFHHHSVNLWSCRSFKKRTMRKRYLNMSARPLWVSDGKVSNFLWKYANYVNIL